MQGNGFVLNDILENLRNMECSYFIREEGREETGKCGLAKTGF